MSELTAEQLSELERLREIIENGYYLDAKVAAIEYEKKLCNLAPKLIAAAKRVLAGDVLAESLDALADMPLTVIEVDELTQERDTLRAENEQFRYQLQTQTDLATEAHLAKCEAERQRDVYRAGFEQALLATECVDSSYYAHHNPAVIAAKEELKK